MRSLSRAILMVSIAVAAASGVAMAINGDWDAAFRFSVVVALLVFTRSEGVPASFAAAFAVFLLIATWAGVAHWYRQVTILDAIVHFLTPGSLAAVASFLLVRGRLLPDLPRHTAGLRSWAPVLIVALVGVTAAVVWEFYEWVVEQTMPARVSVGYTDTIVDLAAGMAGSVVAGLLVLAWSHRHASGDDEPA